MESRRHIIRFPFMRHVFFSVPCNPNAVSRKRVHGVLRYLIDIGGNWCLCGHDLRFAEWIFQYDGIMGLSQVYTVGDRVHIHSGPLKDYGGSILKIDKRSRNGLVEIKFDQKG